MNFDDPKLTAYALGELESAEDRAFVEALLQERPELAAEIEQTRSVALFLRRELHAEQSAALTDAQRNEVFAAAMPTELGESVPTRDPNESRTVASGVPPFLRHWFPSAIAAIVVVGSTIALLHEMQMGSPTPIAATSPYPSSAHPLSAADSGENRGYVQRVPSNIPQSNAGEKSKAFTLQIPQEPPIQIERLAEAPLDEGVSVGKALADSPQLREKTELAKVTVAPAPAPSAPAAASPAPGLTVLAEVRTGARFGRVNSTSYFFDSDSPTSAGSSERGRAVRLEPFDNQAGYIEPFRVQVEQSNTESYDSITDNTFLNAKDTPLSTFSVDVDTASYSNVRRFLTNNQRPPKGAVRIEELINYFPYSYPAPEGNDPFSCTMEVAACPWTPQHRLVRVGLKGREISKEKLPPSNLVFLIDVSGSMRPSNKLPLVKESMRQLVSELREQDTVGIVVYAGSSGTLLEPTSDKTAIRSALDSLDAGGSTNGASGLQGAYDLAQRTFKKAGNNRVILCTDGDFNVGVTSQSELVDLIQTKAKSGIFLSVLGFGMGNTKDSTMEKLADKGNGNYAYIDSLKEGRKVLVEQMAGTLFTIAKDVKIQVEFNPAKVEAYRLIGYENRLLAKEDFNDDTKDAGEIGAGHTVTALYEVAPAGVQSPTKATVDPLKYQPSQPQAASKAENPGEILTLKLRFKQPDGDTSTLREFPLTDTGAGWEKSSQDLRWTAAVASFGMLLRDSPHRGNATWETVARLANEGKGTDSTGYRTEFLQLIDRARQIVPITSLVVLTKQDNGTEKPQGRASLLVLPEFELTDTPILDAIDALSKKSLEIDPDKKGVSIVFAGGNTAAQNKVSLRMRNTSVIDTAKAIATAAGLSLREQGDVLILHVGQQP